MKLSIVIPCYNEAKDIVSNVNKVKEYLSNKKISNEIILVNDGSKDNTKEVIQSIPDVIALSYDNNRGKGGAVKYGIEHATGNYVLFMDADLSTDLSAIDKVIELAPKYDLIIGSRHAKDSVIKKKQPLLRIFIGWCCRVIVNMLFRLKLKDTQCGFKAIRTDIAKKIIDKQLVNNFAFDVEYLYIAKLNNLSMYELGVIWLDDRTSTVSPIKSSIKFFKDLAFIKKNKNKYRFGNNDQPEDYINKLYPIFFINGLMVVLIILFLIFCFTNPNEADPNNGNHSSLPDNYLNLAFHNKLIDIIEKEVEDAGFTFEEIEVINAVAIQDNYPNNFTLNIACRSENNVYIYELEDYPYINANADDNTAFKYLTKLGEFDANQKDVTMIKYPLEDEVYSENKTNGYISYSGRFSGYYLSDNVYRVYFDQSIVNISNPYEGALYTSITQSHQLYSYYEFLSR